MKGGETPGGQGARFAGELVRARFGGQGHGPHGVTKLLLQHPGPVCAGKGRGQLLGAGVAIGGELQGNLQGQGGLGHLIDILRFRCRVDRVQGGQFQGLQVLAQGLVGRQGEFPQQGRGLGGLKAGQPAFPG